MTTLILTFSGLFASHAAELAASLLSNSTTEHGSSGPVVHGTGDREAVLAAISSAYGDNVQVSVVARSAAVNPTEGAPGVLIPEPLAVEPSPAAPSAPSGSTPHAYVLRLSGLDRRALVDALPVVSKHLEGLAVFMEPPTAWEDDTLCLNLAGFATDALLQAAKAASASTGATASVSFA